MCSVRDCSKEAYCRGYCPLHYNRWRKWGTTEYKGKKPKQRSLCQVDNCEKPVHTEGYCNSHLRRWRKYGDPLKVGLVRYHGATCQVQYPNGTICNKQIESKGFCDKHYKKYRQYGDPLADKRPQPNPKAYVTVTAPDGHSNANGKGKILEHRLVMANHLGRPLMEHENIHHINGNRRDNRLENLELWSTSQPPGQRVEDKVKWALELIAFYAPEKLKDIEND